MSEPVNAILNYLPPERRRRIGNALMTQQYDRATPEEGAVAQRHGLLPLATYDNGRTGLAFPGIVAEPVESFNRLLQNGYTSGDAQGVEDAFNVAGAAMMGGIAAPRPRGSLGTVSREQPAGIRAYHGSPHDFDRFDMSKIGTGEGAQAYGHGLYFAENEGVAKSYRQGLSRADGGVDQIAQTLVDQAGGDWKKALQKFEGEALDRVSKARAAGLNYDLPPHDVATLQALRKGEPGRMYEVNIKADPNDFLDWDKPRDQLSPKVRDWAAKTFPEEWDKAADGASLYQLISQRLASKLPPDADNGWTSVVNTINDTVQRRDRATQSLVDAGIPGIRYLDQGSRGAGEGSRNYVVFDDNLVEILRKYGLLGMAGGAATNELLQYLQPDRPASPKYLPGDA